MAGMMVQEDLRRNPAVRVRLGRGPCRALLVDALEVEPRPGVDLDPLPLLDEERDVDGRAGRHLRGLRGAAGGVALDARLALGDLQDDARREIDADRVAVV